MIISRGGFAKVAAGSALVLASGLRLDRAFAKDLAPNFSPDQLDDGGDAEIVLDTPHGKGQTKHPVHEKGPITTPFITDGYKNIAGGSYSDKTVGKPWGGQTHVIIDEEGNWLFGGLFPSHGLGYTVPTNIATGIALSSPALGQAFAWTAQGQLDQWKPDGSGIIATDWSFQKQGTSPLIANLWKYAVKGHKFVGSTSWQLIPNPHPPKPPSGGSGSSGGGSSIGSDVATALGVIGAIAAFF